MAKLFVQAQATSNRSEYVFVQDSASTTGGGKTGIAYNASGFTAYYVRPGGNATAITLATQTVTGAWSSGGWVEVDATNLPGIYRFDIPNAVFATGVDHAVVMLKGASGMAPVSLEYQLVGFNPATAWLTSAQTASAVWGADPTSYVAETAFGGVINATRSIAGSTEILAQNAPSAVWDELTTNHTTHGTFGYNSLRADQASKQGLVTLSSAGNVNRVDADVHAIANDIDAATELKGALLHNGVDYISANMLNASAGSPSIGPYTVLPSGAGADNIVDLNVGTASPLVLNLQDGAGAPFNASGATITATVYTAGGSTVTTYTGSIIAGYIGAISVPLSTAVTATSATYTMLVSVVIGTTTTVFGPLKLVVRAI